MVRQAETRLRTGPGQDVYFHLNHPIKWIRISGVVVAVDERQTKHFYTIDDGSGATLECVVNVPSQPAPASAAGANHASNPLPTIDAPIDVGHVLDIKGSVGTFRENRQIRAEKIMHLRSTEQEVVFWEKVAQLKRNVLSIPWVLDRRDVRRCRKEEEGKHPGRRRKGTSDRHRRQPADGLGARQTKVHREEGQVHQGQRESRNTAERKPLAPRPARVTGLEKRRATKPVTRLPPVTGKYNTLGLGM